MNQLRAVGGLVRRHRPDYQMIIFVGLLLLLGLIVLYAISPARTQLINDGGASLDQAHFMQRQLLYLAVGVAAFIAAANVPLKFWQKMAGKILAASLDACLLLAVFGFFDVPIAQCSLGACRWFNLGFINFQPAELVKFGMLIYLAGFIGRRVEQKKVNDIQETLIPLGILVGITTVFIIGLQKDMGTGLALLGIVGSMLFVAGVNKRVALLSFGGVLAAAAVFIAIAPHRIARITTFFGETSDPGGAAYHITQAKIALGTGGLFGLGLGKNVQSFGYLPEAPNDSIFAIMGEAFGFVGLLVILIILVALLLRILAIMDRVEDVRLRLVVAGVFGWLATHSLLNIGAMVGVVPLTGITLPLLSFGGTSLLFIMLALGLVFHISRYTVHGKIRDNNETQESQNTGSWRRIGGSRRASSSGYQRSGRR